MKKHNFFIKIYYSITSKPFYSNIILEPFKKSVAYLILFALLISIPATIYNAYNIKVDIDQNIEFLNSEQFPSFNLHNGKLEVANNEPFVKTFEKIMIVIIDDTESYTLNDLAGYQFGYLFSSERLIISQSGAPPFTFNYNQLGPITITNDDLIDLTNNITPFIFIGVIIFSLLSTFFTAIIFSLLSSIIANITKNIYGIKITYEQTYKVAIYTCTLPLIINQLIKFVPINISWISIIIFYIINSIYISSIMKSFKDNKTI